MSMFNLKDQFHALKMPKVDSLAGCTCLGLLGIGIAFRLSSLHSSPTPLSIDQLSSKGQEYGIQNLTKQYEPTSIKAQQLIKLSGGKLVFIGTGKTFQQEKGFIPPDDTEYLFPENYSDKPGAPVGFSSSYDATRCYQYTSRKNGQTVFYFDIPRECVADKNSVQHGVDYSYQDGLVIPAAPGSGSPNVTVTGPVWATTRLRDGKTEKLFFCKIQKVELADEGQNN